MIEAFVRGACSGSKLYATNLSHRIKMEVRQLKELCCAHFLYEEISGFLVLDTKYKILATKKLVLILRYHRIEIF